MKPPNWCHPTTRVFWFVVLIAILAAALTFRVAGLHPPPAVGGVFFFAAIIAGLGACCAD